jgi:hypothetical protein
MMKQPNTKWAAMLTVMKHCGEFFSFPIHKRHPIVIYLAMHLENRQKVYFTAQNIVQRAYEPPSTTLTIFFETYQNNHFAQTLLYS